MADLDTSIANLRKTLDQVNKGFDLDVDIPKEKKARQPTPTQQAKLAKDQAKQAELDARIEASAVAQYNESMKPFFESRENYQALRRTGYWDATAYHLAQKRANALALSDDGEELSFEAKVAQRQVELAETYARQYSEQNQLPSRWRDVLASENMEELSQAGGFTGFARNVLASGASGIVGIAGVATSLVSPDAGRAVFEKAKDLNEYIGYKDLGDVGAQVRVSEIFRRGQLEDGDPEKLSAGEVAAQTLGMLGDGDFVGNFISGTLGAMGAGGIGGLLVKQGAKTLAKKQLSKTVEGSVVSAGASLAGMTQGIDELNRPQALTMVMGASVLGVAGSRFSAESTMFNLGRNLTKPGATRLRDGFKQALTVGGVEGAQEVGELATELLSSQENGMFSGVSEDTRRAFGSQWIAMFGLGGIMGSVSGAGLGQLNYNQRVEVAKAAKANGMDPLNAANQRVQDTKDNPNATPEQLEDAVEDLAAAEAAEESFTAAEIFPNVAAPVIEESIEAPVVEETVEAPAVEETVEAPAVEETVEAPSIAEEPAATSSLTRDEQVAELVNQLETQPVDSLNQLAQDGSDVEKAAASSLLVGRFTNNTTEEQVAEALEPPVPPTIGEFSDMARVANTPKDFDADLDSPETDTTDSSLQPAPIRLGPGGTVAGLDNAQHGAEGTDADGNSSVSRSNRPVTRTILKDGEVVYRSPTKMTTTEFVDHVNKNPQQIAQAIYGGDSESANISQKLDIANGYISKVIEGTSLRGRIGQSRAVQGRRFGAVPESQRAPLLVPLPKAGTTPENVAADIEKLSRLTDLDLENNVQSAVAEQDRRLIDNYTRELSRLKNEEGVELAAPEQLTQLRELAKSLRLKLENDSGTDVPAGAQGNFLEFERTANPAIGAELIAQALNTVDRATARRVGRAGDRAAALEGTPLGHLTKVAHRLQKLLSSAAERGLGLPPGMEQTVLDMYSAIRQELPDIRGDSPGEPQASAAGAEATLGPTSDSSRVNPGRTELDARIEQRLEDIANSEFAELVDVIDPEAVQSLRDAQEALRNPDFSRFGEGALNEGQQVDETEAALDALEATEEFQKDRSGFTPREKRDLFRRPSSKRKFEDVLKIFDTEIAKVLPLLKTIDVNRASQQEYGATLVKSLEVIDGITESLGIPQVTGLIVADKLMKEHGAAGRYLHRNGVIIIDKSVAEQLKSQKRFTQPDPDGSGQTLTAPNATFASEGVQVLMHELGHHIIDTTFKEANAETRKAVLDDYVDYLGTKEKAFAKQLKDLRAQKGQDAIFYELVMRLGVPTELRQGTGGSLSLKNALNLNEYMAQRLAAAATSLDISQKDSLVGTFFKTLVDTLRRLFENLRRLGPTRGVSVESDQLFRNYLIGVADANAKAIPSSFEPIDANLFNSLRGAKNVHAIFQNLPVNGRNFIKMGEEAQKRSPVRGGVARAPQSKNSRKVIDARMGMVADKVFPKLGSGKFPALSNLINGHFNRNPRNAVDFGDVSSLTEEARTSAPARRSLMLMAAIALEGNPDFVQNTADARTRKIIQPFYGPNGFREQVIKEARKNYDFKDVADHDVYRWALGIQADNDPLLEGLKAVDDEIASATASPASIVNRQINSNRRLMSAMRSAGKSLAMSMKAKRSALIQEAVTSPTNTDIETMVAQAADGKSLNASANLIEHALYTMDGNTNDQLQESINKFLKDKLVTRARSIDPDNLTDATPEDVIGAALSSFHLDQQRLQFAGINQTPAENVADNGEIDDGYDPFGEGEFSDMSRVTDRDPENVTGPLDNAGRRTYYRNDRNDYAATDKIGETVQNQDADIKKSRIPGDFGRWRHWGQRVHRSNLWNAVQERFEQGRARSRTFQHLMDDRARQGQDFLREVYQDMTKTAPEGSFLADIIASENTNNGNRRDSLSLSNELELLNARGQRAFHEASFNGKTMKKRFDRINGLMEQVGLLTKSGIGQAQTNVDNYMRSGATVEINHYLWAKEGAKLVDETDVEGDPALEQQLAQMKQVQATGNVNLLGRAFPGWQNPLLVSNLDKRPEYAPTGRTDAWAMQKRADLIQKQDGTIDEDLQKVYERLVQEHRDVVRHQIEVEHSLIGSITTQEYKDFIGSGFYHIMALDNMPALKGTPMELLFRTSNWAEEVVRNETNRGVALDNPDNQSITANIDARARYIMQEVVANDASKAMVLLQHATDNSAAFAGDVGNLWASGQTKMREVDLTNMTPQERAELATPDANRIVYFDNNNSTRAFNGLNERAIIMYTGSERASIAAKGVTNRTMKEIQKAKGPFGTGVQAASHVNRFMAKQQTWYHVPFTLFQFLVDGFTTASRISLDNFDDTDARVVGTAKDFLKDAYNPKNIRFISSFANLVTKDNVSDLDMQRWLSQNRSPFSEDLYDFYTNGGNSTFSNNGAVRIRESTLGKYIKSRADRGGASSATLKKLKDIDRVFDAINTTTEMAVRVAYYRAQRKNGATTVAAVARAKRLTNFENNGEYGHFMGALYMFSRAAASGNVELINTFLRSENKARASMFFFGLGAMHYMLSEMFSDEDELGRNKTAESSASLWERNAVYNIFGQSVRIPFGFGELAGLQSVGALTMRAISQGENPAEYAKQIANTMWQSLKFSPDPVGSNPFTSLIPSPLRAPVEIGMNLNALGVPVSHKYDKDSFEYGASDTLRDSRIGDVWHNTTEKLQEWSNGVIDINPNELDHMATSYAGAIAYAMETAWEWARDASSAPEDYIPNQRRYSYVFNNFFSPYFTQESSKFYGEELPLGEFREEKWAKKFASERNKIGRKYQKAIRDPNISAGKRQQLLEQQRREQTKLIYQTRVAQGFRDP